MNTYELQAQSFKHKTGTTMSVKYEKHAKYFDDDKEARDIYRITLRRNGKKYSFRFGQSIASAGTPPNTYDVLTCLTKSDPGTFQNFCDEFGYDTDSRKAEKTYKAVVKEWKGIKHLFGDVLDQLQEVV